MVEHQWFSCFKVLTSKFRTVCTHMRRMWYKLSNASERCVSFELFWSFDKVCVNSCSKSGDYISQLICRPNRNCKCWLWNNAEDVSRVLFQVFSISMYLYSIQSITSIFLLSYGGKDSDKLTSLRHIRWYKATMVNNKQLEPDSPT